MPENNFSINISFDSDSFLRDFSTEYIISGEVFLSDENLMKYMKFGKPKVNPTYRELITKMGW